MVKGKVDRVADLTACVSATGIPRFSRKSICSRLAAE
jgi:hypothetical protein